MLLEITAPTKTVNPKRTSSYSQTLRIIQDSRPSEFDLLQANQDFKISLANNLVKREKARNLVQEVYEEIGYSQKSDHRTYIYDNHPDTLVLIAQNKEDEIVGTITLVQDDLKELPSESIYSSEVSKLRKNRDKIGEVTRLAIKKEYRKSTPLMMSLFHHIYIEAHYHFNLSDFIIGVTPSHANFYKKYFVMDEIGSPKPCPRVENTIGTLLRLDLNKCEKQIKIAKLQIKKNRASIGKFAWQYPYSEKDEINIRQHYQKRMRSIISIETKSFKI